jgi:GGDEF domain-containing protein
MFLADPADAVTVERSLQSLFPLISRRFQSFAEATDASLDVLAAHLPGEIVLGQIEAGDDRLRVLEVRGASIVGVERGTMLPLAKVSSSHGLGPDSNPLEGTSGIDDLEATHLQSLGLAEWIALPLEMSDGAIVGIVAALSRRRGDFSSEHVVLLGLTARMLAYEWERIQTRTKLRELNQRIGAATDADTDTGLPGRARFIDELEHEWKLARRGTVETMAVSFRVEAGDEPAGTPVAVLALKDAADALAGAVRGTDQIGRIGEMELGVAMVGCTDEAGVEALAQRFAHGLRRVTHGRDVKVKVSHGSCSLAGSASAEDAVDQAQRAVGDQGVVATNGRPE